MGLELVTNSKKHTLQELRKYSIPSRELPVKRWNFWHRSLYRVAEIVVPLSFRQLFDIDFRGLSYIEEFPEGTPVIFCGNHRSHLDSIILGVAISQAKRRYLAFMANGKALFDNPILSLLCYLGAFPVYPENPEPALHYAEISLRAGLAVAIYPEGRRYNHHRPQEGRTGVARIIERLNYNVPVIPFYTHGSAEALGIGNKIPLFGRYISVTFDKAMYYHEYAEKYANDTYARYRAITNAIIGKMTDLLNRTEAEYLENLEKRSGIWDQFGYPMDHPSPKFTQ